MNYKTNDEFFKESILFRCICGEYEFFEIVKLDYPDTQSDYSVSLVSRPNSIWDRLKYLFKPEQYVKEIILSQSDIVELKNNIKELLEDNKWAI